MLALFGIVFESTASIRESSDRPDTPDEELLWLSRRFTSEENLMADAKDTMHWRTTSPTSLVLAMRDQSRLRATPLRQRFNGDCSAKTSEQRKTLNTCVLI